MEVIGSNLLATGGNGKIRFLLILAHSFIHLRTFVYVSFKVICANDIYAKIIEWMNERKGGLIHENRKISS